jgi:hypothetical protein
MASTPVMDKSSTKVRSAKGIATMQASSATMEATDTTASHVLMRGPPNMATSPAKDNTSSSKQSSAKGVTINHHQQGGLPDMAATSSKDNSSSKQRRRAKGIKKEQAILANLEMEDTSSNEALINFGRLLNLYQSSPTPPLLTCPWSTCNFVTQGVGMKDGEPVGAEPSIAIQLLGLHVGHAHSETDPDFLSFLVLEKLLWGLPRPPPTITPDTHAAPGHQAGQQEGSMDKVGQQRKPVTIKSPSLPMEKEEGSARVSLHCHLCDL